MSPRPKVSEERKQQILDGAERVFSRQGIDEARMEDIAAETRLGKGTLYLYFRSKDELVTAILDRIFQGELEQMQQFGDASLPAAEAVLRLTGRLTADLTRMVRLLPVIYEFLALAFRNKTVQRALRRYIQRYLEALVPIIERGIQAREFRAVDPQAAAIAIGAIVEGTLLLWVYDRGTVEPERHIDSGVRLLLEGLRRK